MSFHFQNCHELEKMDLEECVQVKTVGFPRLSSEAVTPALMLVSASDHRWNAHTVVHPLPSFTSPGECLSVPETHLVPVVVLISNYRWLMKLQLCPCRACPTANWSLTMASGILAAAPVPMITWRWSSWTTVPWSQMLPWSTWRAAIVWIALSSTTASRLLAPASRD